MKIAVWYHCVINGPRIPSEQWAIDIVTEQMVALSVSGLTNAATEIHIGVNGGDADAMLVSAIAPNKSIVHVNSGGETELATMKRLRDWLAPGWLVFYHHIKGVQHHPSHGFHNWRRNMEKVCVWNWEECVAALKGGAHTCGARWSTPYDQHYWAGNFWWATSEHLMTLPPFDPDVHERRYEAEVWIGKSPYLPITVDFHPGMPMV